MTLRTNARIAGFVFLFYIAAGIAHMVLFQRASGGESTAEMLANIARNATLVRVTVLLALCEAFAALTLGVTLFGLTRDVERDLAVFALCCRVAEAVINAVAAGRIVELLSVATSMAGAAPADAAAASALGGLLISGGGLGRISAICFAAGSTVFSYLFLRSRSIPVWLGWLGLISSVLWLIGFPLALTGWLGGPVAMVMYFPMAVFEVTLAFWLIIKGVLPPPALRNEPARV